MKRAIADLLFGFAVVFPLILTSLAYGAAVAEPTTEGRLSRLERRVQSLTEILVKLDRVQQEIRQLRGELEVQAHALENLKKRQRDLYLDIDRRLGQETSEAPTDLSDESRIDQSFTGSPETTADSVAPEAPADRASQTPVAPPVAARESFVSEDQAYQKAFDLLKQGRYQESNTAFRSFLQTYPAGRFADNAQYWLGETGYVTRDFGRSLEEFEKVLNQYPDSAKIPGAMLKMGYIYFEQQKWTQARKMLTELREKYPASTEARLAADRLERMRSQGR